uniref:Uncharacterized protein n=1 Tax=Picea glauca TaxID=3330 RepID=A0A124GND8_PICGL|nr:hypothetical protein ABT39_MTgene4531 [Picea glauca]
MEWGLFLIEAQPHYGNSLFGLELLGHTTTIKHRQGRLDARSLYIYIGLIPLGYSHY